MHPRQLDTGRGASRYNPKVLSRRSAPSSGPYACRTDPASEAEAEMRLRESLGWMMIPTASKGAGLNLAIHQDCYASSGEATRLEQKVVARLSASRFESIHPLAEAKAENLLRERLGWVRIPGGGPDEQSNVGMEPEEEEHLRESLGWTRIIESSASAQYAIANESIATEQTLRQPSNSNSSPPPKGPLRSPAHSKSTPPGGSSIAAISQRIQVLKRQKAAPCVEGQEAVPRDEHPGWQDAKRDLSEALVKKLAGEPGEEEAPASVGAQEELDSSLMDDACATQARLTCGIDEVITEVHLMSVARDPEEYTRAMIKLAAACHFDVSQDARENIKEHFISDVGCCPNIEKEEQKMAEEPRVGGNAPALKVASQGPLQVSGENGFILQTM